MNLCLRGRRPVGDSCTMRHEKALHIIRRDVPARRPSPAPFASASNAFEGRRSETVRHSNGQAPLGTPAERTPSQPVGLVQRPSSGHAEPSTSTPRSPKRPRKEPACRAPKASRGPRRRGTVPSTPHDVATATSAKRRSTRSTTRTTQLCAASSATEARSSRRATPALVDAISVRSRAPSSAPVRWHSCRMWSRAAGMSEVAADVHADVTWSESSRSVARYRLRERARVAPRRNGSDWQMPMQGECRQGTQRRGRAPWTGRRRELPATEKGVGEARRRRSGASRLTHRPRGHWGKHFRIDNNAAQVLVLRIAQPYTISEV